jgi:hypothetical protein
VRASWSFYVYELIDPRTGNVFYVGKGSGDRIDQHEREAARGMRSRKCEVIRAIQSAGLAVEKRHVASFRWEQDAYDFETERIAEIGLVNLTNVLPGGQRAWAEREAVSALRVAARRAEMEIRKREQTQLWLRRWLQMVDTWHGVTFPNLADGNAKAAELVAFVRAECA